jgi:membrane-associated phospholipid phosphatase
VHYPTQVVGGVLIGAALAQVTTRTMNRWQGVRGA